MVQVGDAIELREAGLTVPVLCLLGARRPARGRHPHGVDLTAGTVALVGRSPARAGAGGPARMHLEADTGMWRGGATSADWPVVLAARAGRRPAGAGRGALVALRLRRHAWARSIGHSSRRSARRSAWPGGRARPEVRHMANTPATLTLPESCFDLVRPGGAVVGLSTLPAARRAGCARR